MNNLVELSTIQGMSYKAGLINISQTSDSKNNDAINYHVLLETPLMKSVYWAPVNVSTYFTCMVQFFACVFTTWQSKSAVTMRNYVHQLVRSSCVFPQPVMTPRNSLSMPAFCCAPVTRRRSLNSVFVKEFALERNLDSRDLFRVWIFFSACKCIILVQVMEREKNFSGIFGRSRFGTFYGRPMTLTNAFLGLFSYCS